MGGFRSETAQSYISVISFSIRWKLHFKSPWSWKITNTSRETDILELWWLRSCPFRRFLDTISSFHNFPKRKFWSKPVANIQIGTEKFKFVTSDRTMHRYRGSPKVLRGSPDAKVDIVTPKRCSKNNRKKVSPMNYISGNLGEPHGYRNFLGIFLISWKSEVLERPKVLRVQLKFCRKAWIFFSDLRIVSLIQKIKFRQNRSGEPHILFLENLGELWYRKRVFLRVPRCVIIEIPLFQRQHFS